MNKLTIVGETDSRTATEYERDAALEYIVRLTDVLTDMTQYVQDLISRIQKVEGGQPSLDKGWDLVTQAWANLARESQ